ncbi:fatty-acid amide hydrolase 2-like [Macrosteles quadrilineatus]|uniref:fatty-acid amide hydrolase 2-like n=1 Tax=Macrosteles quadrilineatus TaxID=74068 RepID=UPI0023E1A04E|nr:fatty-acid amide hydrolase 2-like [Macrosteles quadrilineatus]
MWAPWQQWLVWLAIRPVVAVFWTLSHILCIFHRTNTLPPVSSQLLLYSASDLARMVRSRKVHCQDIIQAYVTRIKEVNPIINAVVQSRFDQALEEAKKIDAMLAETLCTEEELARDKPLLGVPITIKESIPVKGMSNNAGVPNRSRVAKEDSDAVARLRTRGAVVLVVSNTPELCLSWETYNPVTGRTNNPYNTARTSGGSSGGEGALLGSAASVIGLGSDIGGSGRVPASFCGVFGHKPSSGYINAKDHMPTSEDPLWPKVFVFAPMARYSEDLPLLYSSCVEDENRLKELRLDEPVDLRKVKFYYMDSDGSKITSSVCGDVKAALNKTIAHVENSLGVKVEKMNIDEFKHTAQLSCIMLLRMKACHTIFQKSEDSITEWKSVLWQWILWFLCLSPHTLHALIYGAMKKWFADVYSEQEACRMDECKDLIFQKLNDCLGDNGVLLYPAFPDPAHLHMQIYFKQVNAAYLSFFNLVDMPATAFPVMLNSKGLPVGLQAVAGRGQDRLTLAVAREMEKAFGGWVPPTGTDMMEVKS